MVFQSLFESFFMISFVFFQGLHGSYFIQDLLLILNSSKTREIHVKTHSSTHVVHIWLKVCARYYSFHPWNKVFQDFFESSRFIHDFSWLSQGLHVVFY